MNEHPRPISLTKVAAASSGTLGLCLMVANIFVPGEDLGFFGIATIAAGAVLRIRSYFVALAAHQRDMFDLGRAAERSGQFRQP